MDSHCELEQIKQKHYQVMTDIEMNAYWMKS